MFKAFTWLGVLSVAILCCGFTFVGEDAASGTAGLLKGIGAGVLTGVVAAILGFAKDKDPNKKWDFKTAGSTVLIGAIVGAFAGWQKKDLTTAADWFSSGSTIVIAELVWKALWRNAGAPALNTLLTTVKGGAGNPPPQA